MTQLNSKENKNLYTTGIIPTFTFVADGPDVLSKQGNVTKQQPQRTNQVATFNNPELHEQQKEQNNTTTTIDDLSGPLHIIPSWQPLDANDKPPYSYATLIAHAILSSDHRRLTLCDIYQWITQHYPFYSIGEHGWKNSIRHNLSLNKAFVRVQRSSSRINSGKGSFWTIRAGQELVFIDNLIKRRGPIRKQPVVLPRSLHYRRSSRLGTDDHTSSPSHTTSTTTRHINNSPLFTTFRMTPAAAPTTTPTPNNTDRSTKRKRSMPELRRCRSTNSTTAMPEKIEMGVANYDDDDGHDSDCDSGIDVSNNECDKTTYTKYQLKKAKSTPCLFSSDSPLGSDNTATATTTPPSNGDNTFQDLLSTSSDFATTTFDFTSPNWTDSMDLLSSPDSKMSSFLDWGLIPMVPTTNSSMESSDSIMTAQQQDWHLSPTIKTTPSSLLDLTASTTILTDTFTPLDTLTNGILPFEDYTSYNTFSALPSSSCVDSFSLDDFLLDDQILTTNWNL